MTTSDWLVLASTLIVFASLAVAFGLILADVCRDLAEAQRDGSR